MTINVIGMACPACEKRIIDNISKLNGVEGVTANAKDGKVCVIGNINEDEIKLRIEELGFDIK